ncbi:DUF2513 domain-containing protein [Bacillus subtilis]
MQRDMDLIRKLLIGIVDRDFSSIYNEYSREVIDYHMDLLEQEGYIEYTFKTKSGSTIKGLTWKGHDFLEVIKKDNFWEKIKPELKKTHYTTFF